jgi:uncharacterized protein YjbI with pentapeptide repeats
MCCWPVKPLSPTRSRLRWLRAPSSSSPGPVLHKADLSGADLGGADLRKANLHGANLDGADLGGADLGKVGDLTQEQLESARGDEATRLPEGLVRPTSWTKPPAG